MYAYRINKMAHKTLTLTIKGNIVDDTNINEVKEALFTAGYACEITGSEIRICKIVDVA